MFDTAELGQCVAEADFKEREIALRARLLELQYRALELAKFPVLIDFAGVDGAGKGTTVNMLNKWMDPRFLRTVGYQQPSEEERARPRFWRYWRDLPPKGRIGLYLSGRYSQPLIHHVHDGLTDEVFDDRLGEIIRFESALADDGVLILKFWMHLSREAQQQRLDSLSSDPLRSYRVTSQDWDNYERYDDFIAAAEKIITRTNRAGAPWTIVEGVDPNFRHLLVGETLVSELTRHLDRFERGAEQSGAGAQEQPGLNVAERATVFDTLDHSRKLKKREYRQRRPELQAKLGELGRRAYEQGVATVLVFEGPDAAGKGGAIRRTVWSLDARHYRVHQFAAPTDEENAHHYLWRFWRKLPRAGDFGVFDRSWYGRVLVERAEGLASEAEWRRAYNEINDFEQQIIGRGSVLLKFWLSIDKDEQLARFEERARSAYKHWKLTDEDWRNRELWDTYWQLGHDVIQYTSTSTAPWVLVEGNDKHFARVKVLTTVVEHLERRLCAENDR